MCPYKDSHRSIADFSNDELELQKRTNRYASVNVIIEVMNQLVNLAQQGIVVRQITNYDVSSYIKSFPDSVRILTGLPVTLNPGMPSKVGINVSWDFWHNEVVQHVIELEEV